MKMLLSILLITFSLTTFGQTCARDNGKLINCIDQAGLRQGYWETKHQEIIGTTEHCFTYCFRITNNVAEYMISKEWYLDGEKTGICEYYSGDKEEALIKTIEYLANGDVIEENKKGNYSLKIKADSTLIQGSVYRENDTISVTCINNNCHFKTLQGLQLIQFDITDIYALEYEITSLQMHYYDAEIRKVKAREP